MQVDISVSEGIVTLTPRGRVDTVTAAELEKALDENIEQAADLVFDCQDLEYVSSVGLRILLKAQKAMSAKGSLKLTNVNDAVMEILEITGFSEILVIA